MKNNLISIIIPTYNRASLIGETLDSVKNQTYQNWECIIVDDGSTDGTAHVVKKYTEEDSRFRYVKRADSYKPGGNGARNYGFEISNGDFVNWFDDDDVMFPNFLSDKIEAFNNEFYLVISTGYYWLPEKNEKKFIDLTIKESLYEEYSLWSAHILTPSILFRMDFLKNKTLFSDKIIRGQETELFTRLFFQLRETEYCIINKPSFLYRQHEVTKTYQSKKYNSEFVRSRISLNVVGFERNKKFENRKLLKHNYKNILLQLFFAIKNKDENNVNICMEDFFPILKDYNSFIAWQFKTFVGFSSKSKIIYEFSRRYLWRLI